MGTTMDRFTRDDLKRLVETNGGPAVSIYMPTYRAGREVRQNPIRFRNLMKDAIEQLAARAPAEKSLRMRLHEAEQSQPLDEWWLHQSDGLAMFFTADRFERYRVPLSFDEAVTVGQRFQVRPMVRLLEGDGRFYVLAASQNRVRLLQGTHYSVDELEASQLPSDLVTALNIDEYMNTMQQHSTGMWNVAGTMMFHGQGGSGMEVRKKDELAEFFHRIGAALRSYLGAERTPLVFMGVDYLFPLFREACHYSGLVETPVTGNPDELSIDEVHRQAWKVVEPRFLREREAALRRFDNTARGSLQRTGLLESVRAAQQGAVDTLFLAADEEHWGIVDEQHGAIVTAAEGAEGAEELLNYAAVCTLTTGGVVYSLPRERMPEGMPAAALLRFPL